MFKTLTLLLLLSTTLAHGQSRPTVIISSVGQLATRRPFSNEVAQVLYREVPGDMGAPRIFRWDPTNALPTNGIRIASTKSATGRWLHDWDDGDVRVFGVATNTQAFGASTNLTALIARAAINDRALREAIDVATEGGQFLHKELVFPMGFLYFSNTVFCWNSSVASPGTDFSSGRFQMRGAGSESTHLTFVSLTNNCVETIHGRTKFTDLSINAAPVRKAATNLITDPYSGNGLVVNLGSVLSASHHIENVFLKDHPNNGMLTLGSAELLRAESVTSQNNGQSGFAIEFKTLGAVNVPPFWHHYKLCRAVGNGNKGWKILNGYGIRLESCQAVNNGHTGIWVGGGKNVQLVNCDVEHFGPADAYKAALAPSFTATNVTLSASELITLPGFDWAAHGVRTNMYVVLHGSAVNSYNARAWRIREISSTDTLWVSDEYGGMVSQTLFDDPITFNFTGASTGISIDFVDSVQVDDGFLGTLSTGMYLNRATNLRIKYPLFVNANVTDWIAGPQVIVAEAVTNSLIQVRDVLGLGYANFWLNRSATERENSLWVGSVPYKMQFGDLASTANDNLIFRGFLDGSYGIQLYRGDVDAAIGFSMGETPEGSFFQLNDASATLPINRFQASTTLPRIQLGSVSYRVDPSYTKVGLEPGGWANSVTNDASGKDLSLYGGYGTGSGTRGIVTIGGYARSGTASAPQTTRRDIAAIGPTGLLLESDNGSSGLSQTLLSGSFDSNLVFQVKSANQVALPVPLLTTTQRDAVAGTNIGLLYNTTANRTQVRVNGAYYEMPRMLNVTGGVNFDEVPANGVLSTTIAATGVETTDAITVHPQSQLPLIFTAVCLTNDVILVSAFNVTATPTNPPSANFSFWVTKN